MSCNAWNHSASCDCGWGGQWHGNQPPGGLGQKIISEEVRPACRSVSAECRIKFGDYHSLTTPNARCPVCGVSVFFYQNSYGSRVFFDELGPPWPKHPCTDRSGLRSYSGTVVEPRVGTPKHRADWLLNGWQPHKVLLDPKGRPNSLFLRSFADDSIIRLRTSLSGVTLFPIIYVRPSGTGIDVSGWSKTNMRPVNLISVEWRVVKSSAQPISHEAKFLRDTEIKKQIEAILANRFSYRKRRRI
jgi:hypothetical protein